MPTLQVAFTPGTKEATVQETGAALPDGAVNIGTFNHPDETYPDSVVIYHGVRDLLYKCKPDGTPGFWPDNVVDMQSISIINDLPVLVPLFSISVTPATASVVEGATQQLTVAYTPDTASNKTVTYASSDEAVATVSETGLVTAVAAGEAIITVTAEDGNKTDTVAITVTAG